VSRGKVLLIAWFWGMAVAALRAQSPDVWHTPPDTWLESRNTHSPFDTAFSRRIQISRVPFSDSCRFKLTSPNNGYWFAVDPAWTAEVHPECRGAEFQTDQNDLRLFVYNERDYLVKITWVDYDNRFTVKAVWINEKLLYVQAWWGRALGLYLILDVEKEKPLIMEMVRDGTGPFRQSR